MHCRYHSFKILKYNIIREFILTQGGIKIPNPDWARGGAGDGGGN